MKFCIVTVVRNEAKNIPKMAETTKEYRDAGGKIYLFDTGSTDDTIQVAKELGFIVTQSKSKFHKTLTKAMMNKWKTQYKITCTPVQTPIDFFCFDDARNAAADIPEEDVMFFADGCDHFINLNYKEINKLIDEGYNHFTTIQKYGGSKGGISRFYNRKIATWIGHVHENIVTDDYDFLGKPTNIAKKYELPEDIFCIEHKIVQKERGDKYMAGLICTHLKYSTGRWHYYVARELWIRKQYTDARRLFQKRYECLEYPEERAAAMCWAAKCKKEEGGTEDEVYEYYKKAYDLDTTLREACFEYCEYHYKKKNWVEVLAGANKCVKIIGETDPLFFEDYRFNEKHNLSWYLYHGHKHAGTMDMALYYWRNFVKTRGIVEEKHEFWKELSKYKYFPEIPYEIKEFTYKSSDAEEVYKRISNIEDKTNPITSSDQLLIEFARKFTPPCTIVIDANGKKGFFAISMSKLVYPAIVHAFETFDYKEMVTNAFINSRKNIKTHEYALSNKSEKIDKALTHALTENQKSKKDANQYTDIFTRLLDDFDFDNHVSVIKICNGSTHLSKTIQGAHRTIKKYKPTIIVERTSADTKTVTDTQSTDKLTELTELTDEDYKLLKTKNIDVFIPKHLIDKKRVAILCYASDDVKWDSDHFNNKYIEIGECEYAVVNLAKALANSNICVDVWCNTNRNYEYESNPRYLNYKQFHGYFESSCYYNAVIYWRYDYEIKVKHPSTKNILWIQEHIYPKHESSKPLIDTVVVLSENHKATFFDSLKDDEKSLNFFKDRVRVIPNGIDVRIANVNSACDTKKILPTRIKYRCVYLNCRAYGLDTVLKDWVDIREKFPTATLYILYGPQTWGINTQEQEVAMSNLIKSMRDKGVYAQHTPNQQYLHEFLQTCDFWLYPCPFEEVYCIQGVHAIYNGVIPIVSDQRFLRTLIPSQCMATSIENGEFGKKCIEVMSFDDNFQHEIREFVTSLGKQHFCDLDRLSALFQSII